MKPLYYSTPSLPWDRAAEEEKLFRKLFVVFAVVFVILLLVLPMLDLKNLQPQEL